MSFVDFRARYIANVEGHRLWKEHAFFLGLKDRPSMQTLGTWLVQGGKIEERFPRLLRTALENDAIPEALKPAIRENLDDELGNGSANRTHFSLYKEALESLEIDFDEYERTAPSAATRVLLRGLFGGARSSDPIEALSRLATEELLPPAEFPPLVRALDKSVGGRARSTWEPYFRVHIECDRGHSSDLIEGLYKVIGANETLARKAFEIQAEHLKENVCFYDWLCEESGLT